VKVKGVAERGLGQDKREKGRGERGRKGQGSGSGTQQQPNLELQHLIIYQWKVRHILPKIFFIQYNVKFLSSPYKNKFSF
jgi:hypothetical protein